MLEKIIPWAISLISFAFAWYTHNKKETKDSTVVIATVTQQMKNLEDGVAELNRMMRESISESRDHGERIIKLEDKYDRAIEEIKELRREIKDIKEKIH